MRIQRILCACISSLSMFCFTSCIPGTLSITSTNDNFPYYRAYYYRLARGEGSLCNRGKYTGTNIQDTIYRKYMPLIEYDEEQELSFYTYYLYVQDVIEENRHTSLYHTYGVTTTFTVDQDDTILVCHAVLEDLGLTPLKLSR